MYFISYSSYDANLANRLRTTLTQRGFECWMAPESIPAGSNYAAAIPQALRDCDAVILLLSEAAQRSMWVAREIDIALNERKRIIPLRVDQSELTGSLKLYLCNVQHIEAAVHFDAALDVLCAQLRPGTSPMARPVAAAQPEVDFDFFDELRKQEEHYAKTRQPSSESDNSKPESDNETNITPSPILQLPFCRKKLIETQEGLCFTIVDEPDCTTLAFLVRSVLNPSVESIHKVPCPLRYTTIEDHPSGHPARCFTLPDIRVYDYDNSDEWGDDFDIILITINHTLSTAYLNTVIISDQELYVSEEPTNITFAPLPSRNSRYMLNWKAFHDETLASILELNLNSPPHQSAIPVLEHVEVPFRQECFSYTIIDPDTAQPIIPEVFTGPNSTPCIRFDFDPSKKYICVHMYPYDANVYGTFGVGYLMGIGGPRKNIRRAAEWFRKGADATPPDFDCAYELGCMLYDLPEIQDKEAARRYLTLAAKAGHHQAMFELARQAIEENGSTADLLRGRDYLQQLIAAGRERSGETTLVSLLGKIDAALR